MTFKLKRKGQSALEFLTTYGWAFLVILIMIGALSYFGVLNPSRFLPDKCIFGSGIGGCTDSAVVVSGANSFIAFKIVNNFGKDLTITSASAVVTGLTSSCTTPILRGNYTGGIPYNPITTLGAWNSSTELQVNITGCTIATGERATASVTIGYRLAGSSYTKTVDGEVAVKR